MAKGFFRVLVALSLAGAAGRKKLNGIHRFLGEGYDWDMELVRDEADFTEEVLENAAREGFNGVFVGFGERPEMKRIHEKTGIPTVFIGQPDAQVMKRLPLCLFVNDDHNAIMRLAMRHLRSCRGMRTLGFVPSRTSSKWSDARRDAFKAAMRGDERRMAVYDGSGDSREALGRWLMELEKPAGIVAALDDRAHDVTEACRSLSIKVPDDVSVLGIGNDEPVCETTVPALSSVAVDFELEGYRAARELQAMMLRPATPTARTILCGAHEVVSRASTTASRTPTALVRRAMEFIDRHALEGISAADVVGHLRVSRSLADLRFRKVSGTSIQEAILDRRIGEVGRLLRETDLRISEIAVRCGYRDANYLKNLFKKRFGMTMREWRSSGIPLG